MRTSCAVTRMALCVGTLICAVVGFGAPARAQTAADGASSAAASEVTTEPRELTAGVYPRATRGTVPVRFEIRGAPAAEPIGVTPESDDASYATFSPGCATPCTLWFERGRHFVRLGQSPLRTRIFELNVDARASTLRFSRDAALGVAAGVIIAASGAIAMIVGVPSAAYTRGASPGTLAPFSSAAAPWWALAGGGLAVFVVGAVVTFTSFGSSEIVYPDAHETRRIPPPIGAGATDR